LALMLSKRCCSWIFLHTFSHMTTKRSSFFPLIFFKMALMIPSSKYNQLQTYAPEKPKGLGSGFGFSIFWVFCKCLANLTR
jgi:hypothetical protein